MVDGALGGSGADYQHSCTTSRDNSTVTLSPPFRHCVTSRSGTEGAYGSLYLRQAEVGGLVGVQLDVPVFREGF